MTTSTCRECHLPKPDAWTGADLIREINGVFAKADRQLGPEMTAHAFDMGLRLLRANAAGYCNGCAVVAVTTEMEEAARPTRTARIIDLGTRIKPRSQP